MNFVSWAFIVLFAVNLVARYTVGRQKTERPYVWVLTVSSLVFYAWHIPVYLSLMLATIVCDYLAGSYLGRQDRPLSRRQRQVVLAAALTVDLGLLALFKYGDFGLSAVRNMLTALGASAHVPELGLALPMGISFYTFQSMSYTIDIYRGTLQPVHSFRRYLLYVSFFPQLVAGPIVRASEFLPQMLRPRRPRLRVCTEGVYLLISGFFLKMVCADNLSRYVDARWDEGYLPGADSGVLIWLVLMFGCQIFCDFAGYSNIARGAAYLLGYRLPINFNFPFVADSFMNFWQRWHMTLSRWLRDYLYASLRGRRKRVPLRRQYVIQMLTMVLAGLWHGAAWTFVIWGALHGAALVVERMLGMQGGGGWKGHPVVRLGWLVVVQTVVLVTWVFFRSDGLGPALQFLANMGALDFGAVTTPMWVGSLFMLPVFLMHCWQLFREWEIVGRMTPAFKAVLSGAMLYGIATAYGSTNAFIYFRF